MKQYMRNTIHHSCNILPMKDYHCIKNFSYIRHNSKPPYNTLQFNVSILTVLSFPLPQYQMSLGSISTSARICASILTLVAGCAMRCTS